MESFAVEAKRQTKKFVGHSSDNQITGLRRVPKLFDLNFHKTSPRFSSTGGVRKTTPTPSGVPVAIHIARFERDALRQVRKPDVADFEKSSCPYSMTASLQPFKRPSILFRA